MNNCDDCKYWNDALVMCTHPFGENCVDGFSLWWPKQSVTNADRIRSMSDEEFSHFLFGIQCAPASKPKEWLDWLRQEAQEGE